MGPPGVDRSTTNLAALQHVNHSGARARREVPIDEHRLLYVLLALPAAGLVACGGDGGGSTGPDDPDDDPGRTVASVEVSPDTAAASEPGETVRFEAEARDADGRAVSGVSFTWSSSDGSVATVDGGGTAAAEANGAADIEATASGVTGSAHLAVRAGELRWHRVTAGPFNSCGVTTHGTVYCWGSNRHGELGDDGPGRSSPVHTESGLYFTDVRSSGQTCALAFDGSPYCWGSSAAGERGDGTTGDSPTHSPVSTTEPFDGLTTGGNHTCGVAADGTAYCWGLNGSGQLGDGTTTDRHEPVPVEGDLRFRQVSAGRAPIDNHTCGTTTGGEAYCWGPNGNGELGDGTTQDRHEPVPVEGDLTFDQISTGGGHTCAVTAEGTAYCWGANSTGQLGDGANTERHEPVPVDGDLTFSVIGAGADHTCGLTTDGVAYCWGENGTGQVGDGTTQRRSAPTEVAGGHAFARLHVGNDHSCGVTTGGTAYCWGNNSDGQLGDGTSERFQSEPSRVPDPGEID